MRHANPSADRGTQGACQSLSGSATGRATFRTEPSPDLGYLLFNISSHLLESDQSGFE
jgi:hypothetical protein